MRFILALSVALLASPASALTASQKAAASSVALPPVSATCKVQNNSTLPYLCADFQNGVYILNGVQYRSYSAMGFTTSGACSVAKGSGVSCNPNGYLKLSNSQNPASGYMIVVDASDSTAQAFTDNALIYDGAHFTGSIQQTTSRTGRVGGGTACGTQTASNTKDASYQSSTTAGTCSVAGGTASSVTSQTAPPANTPLYVGGIPSSPNSIVPPNFVRSVRIYLGTFTNGQVQTASTQ